MIPDLGFATLLIALFASVFAAGASWYGARTHDDRWVESARNAMAMTMPLTFVSCLILIYLMWTNDFSVAYVAQVTSIESPKYLKVTALWGSQAGSLLFWNFLLAVFTAASMMRKWHAERELMPYAIMVASFTQIFFLFISVYVENPFARLESVPLDGQGLNPLLRHVGMIIHPPMLYLGFVGFTVPFAFAMAALMTGRLDDAWIRTTRRWTLVAWLFLSLGLILGGRWAYDVLGWGGYWAWDPVENASFMPWLSGTAFLHSVMIQEKRGMFRMWNMFLIILTYLLVISGTFIVRSGLISSVHTFAQSSIGWYFFVFIAFMVIFSVYWMVQRWQLLASNNRLESLLSREAAFLLNNFIILAILAATALGVYFPVLSELVADKVTVGPAYYEKVNGPLFGVLVLLMGVAPLTMWHRTNPNKLVNSLKMPTLATTAIVAVIIVAFGINNWWSIFGMWVVTASAILTILEFVKGTRARMKRGEGVFTALSNLMARNRRRYGGYCIHLGVIIMAIGIIGIEFFQQETQVQLNRGESLSLGEYRMQFNGVREYSAQDDLRVKEASIDVYKNGSLVKQIAPRSELYLRSGQPMTIPDSRSTPIEDFYVLMTNWEAVSAETATFRAYLNPLVNWIWWGGFVFTFGTMIAGWPDAAENKVIAARRRYAVAAGD